MKLRIAPDGRVSGLWDDAVDWRALGRIAVRRASHVEFCPKHQQWYVQIEHPRGWMRRMLQLLLRRPFGEILFWANTRADALAWEREHLAPGGAGWPKRVTVHAPHLRN